MIRRTLLAASMLISSTVFPQVTNFEAPGNLKSETVNPPMAFKDISNNHNPVDLFQLVRAMIKQKKYDEAALTHMIAFAYGTYDTFRVEDVTAHQAHLVLIQVNLGDLPMRQKKKFMQELELLMKDKQKVLDTLDRLGKPTYEPKYMIQHGMGAFVGNRTKDGLVPNFDPDKAWSETKVQIFPAASSGA